MGAQNQRLKWQWDAELGMNGENGSVDNQSRHRWGSCDERSTKENIKHSPRALCWVLEVDNIENTVKKCGYNPGEILQISRGELTWKITVPSNGGLADNGVLPALIEWPSDQHPSKKLTNSKVSIIKLSLFHPESYKIKNIISHLIKSDLIRVSEGVPKIELILTTQNGKVVID